MEHEMHRRRFVRSLGALAVCLREGRLFRIITSAEAGVQDRACMAPNVTASEVLAREKDSIEHFVKVFSKAGYQIRSDIARRREET